MSCQDSGALFRTVSAIDNLLPLGIQPQIQDEYLHSHSFTSIDPPSL